MSALDGFMVTRIVVAAVRLGIVRALFERPRTTHELASIAEMHTGQVGRLLAALEGIGIIRGEQEDRTRCWSLRGRTHQADDVSIESVIAYAELIDAVYYPAWSGFADALRNGESAIQLTFGRSLWEMMSSEPATSKSFASMMRNNNVRSARSLFELYDFPSHGTVVDLGGGDATFVCQLLARLPNLSATVVESASQLSHCLTTVDEHGLRDRCECVAGDFLRSVPAGGDVYILRSVLHNWRDPEAVRILENCAAAMTDDSTLLVIERVKGTGQDALGEALRDVNMLVLFGAEDRDFEQYARLLESACLRVVDQRPNPRGPSVIVARRK